MTVRAQAPKRPSSVNGKPKIQIEVRLVQHTWPLADGAASATMTLKFNPSLGPPAASLRKTSTVAELPNVRITSLLGIASGRKGRVVVGVTHCRALP